MNYNTIEDLRAAMEALPHPYWNVPSVGEIESPYSKEITLDMIKGMIAFHLIEESEYIGSGRSGISILNIMDFMEAYPEITVYGYINFDSDQFLIEGIEYTGKINKKMKDDFSRRFFKARYIEVSYSRLKFMAG